MHKLLPAALGLMLASGVALAQTTTTSQTTTTVTPSDPAPLLVAPPPGTLATTRTEKITSSDGSQTEKTETTYRNTEGVADNTMTRTTTIAPAQEQTTSWSSSSTTTITPVPALPTCTGGTHYDKTLATCEK